MNKKELIGLVVVGLIVVWGVHRYTRVSDHRPATAVPDQQQQVVHTNDHIQQLVEKWSYAVQSETGSKDEIDGVSADSKSNVYIGGLFHDTVDFGGTRRTAKNGGDIFVAKLDPDGNEIWFKTFDFGANDFMWDLTVDKNDDVIISGGIGGAAADNSHTVNETVGIEALFAKLSGTTGEIVWQKTATAEGAGLRTAAGGNEVIVDNDNNSIFAMMAGGEQYLIDGVSYSGEGTKDGFIIKRNQNGNVVWVYQFHGQAFNQIRAIGVTADGYITFGLEYTGTITDEQGRTLVESGNRKTAQGAFGMLTPEGTLAWIKPVMSDGFATVRGAGGDQDGYGYYTGVVTGNGTVGTTVIDGFKNGTSFLAKYDTRGNQTWLRILGNNESDEGGELIVYDDKVAISGVNNGDSYNVYDESGRLLNQDIFPVNARVKQRASLVIFDQDGTLVAEHTPAQTDASNGDVLEYIGDGCLAVKHMFFGTVTYFNGDTYTAPNTVDIPGFPYNKDEVLLKLCEK